MTNTNDYSESGLGIGGAGRIDPAAEVSETIARRGVRPVTPPRRDGVRCDCGHTVPPAQVLNASLGTSCPDCYDRMSDAN